MAPSPRTFRPGGALAALLTLLVGIQIAVAAETALTDTAQTSLDWSGHYAGLQPCSDCPGIETWLQLRDEDGAPGYVLIENRLGATPDRRETRGQAHWRPGRSVLQLSSDGAKRSLFVAEHRAFLFSGEHPPRPLPTHGGLHQLATFADNERQLLVDPRRVEFAKDAQATRVRFPAVMNLNHASGASARALRGGFIIDCTRQSYEIAGAQFFHEPFATGERIDTTPPGQFTSGPLGDASATDALTQAARAFCPE